ncbi:MAG: triose-phosphate isomerase [Patescibacteria group bacterium]
MKYVIANWKMNLSVRESVALVRGVLLTLQGREHFPRIVLCPSATALSEVHKLVTRTHLELGAQNAGPERAGAMTGEVGLAQLEDVGCSYAIIGHSERRLQFNESDEVVRQRLTAVLASQLTPVLCVGESREVREAGQAEAFVLKQLKSALVGQHIARDKRVVVAYEPIWAIGAGQPATPAEAIAMHATIRQYLQAEFGLSGDKVAILYGGSIDGENAHQFLRESEIDGVLVGGASIKATEFAKVLAVACEVMEAQATV